MFLTLYCHDPYLYGPPHASGGVSMRAQARLAASRSSPREWGCFFGRLRERAFLDVLPTRVGVFPPAQLAAQRRQGPPHASGGVSSTAYYSTHSRRSSPREWGCFRYIIVTRRYLRVLPTRVGVFPSPMGAAPRMSGPPHASGGVSDDFGDGALEGVSSPREWGCFP